MNELFIQNILLSDQFDGKDYFAQLPVVQHLKRHKELPLSRPVTFFVGENGTGKSTLLEAVAAAYGFNPEGGGKNFSSAPFLPIPTFTGFCSFGRVRCGPPTAFFCARKAFIIWQATSIRSIAVWTAGGIRTTAC